MSWVKYHWIKIFWSLVIFSSIFALFALADEISGGKVNDVSLIRDSLLNPWVQLFVGSITFFLIVPAWCKSAWNVWKTWKFIGLDFLISFSAVVSFIASLTFLIMMQTGQNLSSRTNGDVPNYSYFYTTTMLLFFANLGHYLESKIVASSNKNLEALENVIPKKIVVINGKDTKIKAIEDIKVGEIIRVAKGGLVPFDCELISEKAKMNNKIWTGNTDEQIYQKGNEIISGSVNVENAIELKVIRPFNASSIAQLFTVLSKSKNSSDRITNFTEKASKYVFIIQVILFIASLLFWMLFLYWYYNENIWFSFAQGFLKGMTMVIIVCPCAFSLTAPLLLTIAVWKGYRQNIAIKNFTILDEISKINCIAFDKTGTLTKSGVKIINLESLNDNQEYLDMLYSIELYSNHPIAKSICHIVSYTNLYKFEDVREIVGSGIEAKYNKQKIVVGDRKHILSKYPNVNFNSFNQKNVLCIDNEVVVGFDVDDNLKENAISTIINLQKDNYDVYILTGDNSKSVSSSISNTLEKSNIFTNLSPKEKGEIIDMLQQEHFYNVMYVGDGFNDAFAAHKAKIFLPIYSGNDFSLVSGDVILLNDRIENVHYLIKLLAATNRYIKIAIIWSFIYNIIAIILGLLGIIPTALAGLSMIISDLILFAIVLFFKYKKIT
ncbi:MAG: heavy metal translocating P-type ATPase [Mycoplasma sp.]